MKFKNSELRNQRIRQSLIGHTVSPETRQKISNKIKELWNNPQYRSNQLIKRKNNPNIKNNGFRIGSRHTDVAKKKMSGRIHTITTKIKMSKSRKRYLENHPSPKGYSRNAEFKQKVSDSIHQSSTPEQRSRRSSFGGRAGKGKLKPWLSKQLSDYWSSLTPQQRNEEMMRRIETSKRKPNKIEVEFLKIILQACPNEYIYVGDYSMIIGGKCPDYMNVNGKKKLIELFGDYWHEKGSEWKRIEHFSCFGFDCLVIWESELKTKPKEEIVSKIRNFNDK